MINPRNRRFCLAEDIAEKIFHILKDAPNGPDELTILASPEMPLGEGSLPFVSVDVLEGDATDTLSTRDISNDGETITVVSIITLNFRTDMTEGPNNGIAAAAKYQRWAMRTLMNDRGLRQMCEGPILPVGWYLYGDTHEVTAKGLIQKLSFRHKLNISEAWADPPPDPQTP
jgi:hypothetical protein